MSDNFKQVAPENITRPDILYKIDISRHLTLVRSLAIGNPSAYPRAVKMLKVMLSPYLDSEFYIDLKNIEQDTKLVEIDSIITSSRKEDEINQKRSEYDLLYADLLLEKLLFLMNRLSMLLEETITVDFGGKDEEVIENADTTNEGTEQINQETDIQDDC